MAAAAAAMILVDLLEMVEEEEIMRETAMIMKTLRSTIHPFDLTDEQFVKVFRLSKEAVHYLCDALQETLQRRRRTGLSVETQFFATGSYQECVGNDYLASVSQPAVSRAIKAVAVSITELLTHQWIQFPRTEEKRAALKRRFQEARQFKGVIDCTHVAIVKPSIHEEVYSNHKGFHSINVQAVSSHDLEILSLNARFPGTVHDSFIWRHSAVRNEMIRLYESGDQATWLLGDSGYGLEPWLMTPITPIMHPKEAQNSEARYTLCHTATRNSCAVLHNIRLRYNITDLAFDIDEEDEAEPLQINLQPHNLEARDRIRMQAAEIIGADEAQLNP
ncbi:PREDICTED: putative nuclease HARBI1, partial [Vollenhovia emeryi]|uniref:putative nuclease HARBI1 n=1 Tax=Vollenhovia emeryi TaxID=411798 RepID=UPI0005F578E7